MARRGAWSDEQCRRDAILDLKLGHKDASPTGTYGCVRLNYPKGFLFSNHIISSIFLELSEVDSGERPIFRWCYLKLSKQFKVLHTLNYIENSLETMRDGATDHQTNIFLCNSWFYTIPRQSSAA